MGWYYKIEDKQWGPVSVAQLLQLIHSGAIPPEGRVRQGEDSPWITVDQIQSVLSGAGTLVTRPESTALQPLSSVPPTQKLPVPVRRRKKRRPVQASNAPHPVIVAMGTALVLLVALLLIEHRFSNAPMQFESPAVSMSSQQAAPARRSTNPVDATGNQQTTASPRARVNDSKLVERTDRSVVQIESASGNGSGFIIDSTGTVATNLHVVQNIGSAEVKFVDGSRYEIAGFVALAEEKDLVLLRIRTSRDDFEPLPVITKLPHKGETVYALGAPRGYLGSITDGIVSAIRTGTEIRDIAMDDADGTERLEAALDFSEDITWIQTSSPISPGNSGGPLVNSLGEVVGVNTWIQTDAQNINFALSSESLQQLIDNRQGLQPLAMLPAGREPTFVTHQRRQEEELRQQRIENKEMEKRKQQLASTSRSKRTAGVAQELSHLQNLMKECNQELKEFESDRAKIITDRERIRRSAKAVYLESENSAQRRRQSGAELSRLNKILLSKQKKANYTDAEWGELVARKEALISIVRHLQEHAKIIDRRHKKLMAQDKNLEERLKFNFVDWQMKKEELSLHEIRYMELGNQFLK
ncbi:MAG: trypsin-like peptidase domain-containing protein [Pirellulales bacterium]|jgi:S1-C subfamily serine protease|nr:trypsin-like peptidase domain-containing protein [Pirellulales bacterium]